MANRYQRKQQKNNFSVSTLEYTISDRLIDIFEQRFGPAHMRLACHAAVPYTLTPDLLHAIRVNILRGQEYVPWVAGADLLLSDLCRELTGESYQMDLTVREILLKQLNNRYPPNRGRQVAQLALAFNRRTPPQLGSQIQQFQENILWGIIEPEMAADSLAKQLHTRLASGVKSHTSVTHLAEDDRFTPAQVVQSTEVIQLIHALRQQIGRDSILVKYAEVLTELLTGRLSAAKEIYIDYFTDVRQEIVLSETVTLPSFDQIFGSSSSVEQGKPARNNQSPPPTDGPAPPAGSGDDDHDCLEKLFVWRQELQDLIDFSTAPHVSRRLRTVAGPPGYGKSWLLQRLNQILSNNSKKEFKELVPVRMPLTRFESFEDMQGWLQDVVDQAAEICPQVTEINVSAPPESVIGHLLEKLCEKCTPTFRIILIVDALDELPDNLVRVLENRILEKFWHQEQCVRMVVSFRDDFKLINPNLRRGEKRIKLAVFSEEDGREQLEKRAKDTPERLNISFAELSQLVAPYKFTHPGINTLLSQTVNENEKSGRGPVLVADDLRICWGKLLKTPLAPEPGYAAILESDLKAVAVHPEDGWTFETFAGICGYSQTEAFTHWQDLMKQSVVKPHQNYKSRYIVIDGLRELLRAELRLREGGENE